MEKRFSDSIRQLVQIGGIEARWDGLHPDFIFSEITVYDDGDVVVFSLDKLEVQVSTLALFVGEIDVLKLKFSALNYR